MAKSAYERWLKFISKPTSISGLTFPKDEAAAIMVFRPCHATGDGTNERSTRPLLAPARVVGFRGDGIGT